MARQNPVAEAVAPQTALVRQVGRLHGELCRRLARLAQDLSPGAVHDGRVAARRLRSVLQVLQPALDRDVRRRYTRDLRLIMRTLGPAREADVRQATLRSLLVRMPDEDACTDMRALLRSTARRRREIRAQLRTTLAGDEWRRLRSRLDAEAGVPALEAAARRVDPAALDRRIRRRYRRARRCMRRRRRSGRRLHRLRLRIKKLRYAGELVQVMRPQDPMPELGALRRLQDRLGEVHDLWLLRNWLRREAPPNLETTAVIAAASREKKRLIRDLNEP